MHYTIGLDFGTLSVRAVVVCAETGSEEGTGISDYAHGVMSETLPTGEKLPLNWALQHPTDYLNSMTEAIHQALARAAVSPESVIGIGLDMTSDTMLPVDKSNTPLCLLPEWETHRNAYVKLWKHHGAQKQANCIQESARKKCPELLRRYGGQVSAEWMLPKLLETLEEDPLLYAAAERFVEAGDWIVDCLTGSGARAMSYLGFKAFYDEDRGFPEEEWLASLNAGLRKVYTEKLFGTLLKPGERAGTLNKAFSARLGLPEGIAVAVGNTDALTPMPALGLMNGGDLLMSIGTSTCHILLSDECRPFVGICGVVKDGIIPGVYGYEAGQSCVGDMFAWAAEQVTPAEYSAEAVRRHITVQQLLTEKAERLEPGQSGLLALDWWNGTRSVLMDADLTGLILGLTLHTRPEEIYRALLESTAYGTRLIIERFEKNGVQVSRVFACGGVARKNALLMQLMSDILGLEINVAESANTAALGSAIFAAAAAGHCAGGYDTVAAAAEKMHCGVMKVYTPRAWAHAIYNELYSEYSALHDYFGLGGNPVMKRLLAIKKNTTSLHLASLTDRSDSTD